MRGAIAIILLACLLLVLSLTLIYICDLSTTFDEPTMDDRITTMQGIGSALLTPLVGLICAVTGLYYDYCDGQTTAHTVSQTAAQTLAQR
jgi:hypothetical protein